MSPREIFARAVATAVQTATAVLIASGAGLADVDVLAGAGLAALAGVVTVAHRTATRWLEANPDN